jgi:hypothetical protein
MRKSIMTIRSVTTAICCALGALPLLVSHASAQNAPVTDKQRATAEQIAQLGVPISDLAPNAPNSHIVKRGDTLWAISGLFLKSPWKWPELWGMNKAQIRNPNLIYPGQTLYLLKKDGYALLTMTGPDGSRSTKLSPSDGNRLSPSIRVESMERNAIASIPGSIIEPFLSQPLIVDETGLKNSARIVSAQENGRVFLGRGDEAYIRGGDTETTKNFQVFRPAKSLKDPETGAILAYEAFYLGTAEITRTGDPATISISSSKEEMGIGDRLLPATIQYNLSYIPHAPEQSVNARVVSIYNGVDSAGGNMIITVNKGKQDGLEMGHTLGLYTAGKTIRDKTAGAESKLDQMLSRGEQVKLPDERTGTAIVFRVFDKISYALIMGSTRPVSVGDKLMNP